MKKIELLKGLVYILGIFTLTACTTQNNIESEQTEEKEQVYSSMQASAAVSKRLPEVYRKIAKKNDISFLAASQNAGPSNVDQEHLNEKGHVALANAIVREMGEIVED